MPTTADDVQTLILKGEDPTVEFKREIPRQANDLAAGEERRSFGKAILLRGVCDPTSPNTRSRRCVRPSPTR